MKLYGIINLWLSKKGFNCKDVGDGYVYGYDENGDESRWCLRKLWNSHEAEIVFEGWALAAQAWYSGPYFGIAFDLREPDSLTRLENKIREFIARGKYEEEKLLENLQSEIEGLSDFELNVKVQDLNEFEPRDDPVGWRLPHGNLRDRLEEEFRKICATELEWRNKNPNTGRCL